MTEVIAGVGKHPYKSYMEELWRAGWRATDIASMLEKEGKPGVKIENLARYGQRNWSQQNPQAVTTIELEEERQDDDDTVAQARRLIADVEASGVGTVKSVTIGQKKYQGWIRDGDGPAVSDELTSAARTITITPTPQPEKIPLVQAGPTTVTLKGGSKNGGTKPDGFKVGVFLPDMQMGYFDSPNGEHTVHDEAAIDVAHQIMADLQATHGIDLVVNAGDNIDFPEFSSHRSAPGFWGTTQKALNRAEQEAAMQRALAPDARIVWLAGNHEQRLTNFLVDKAPALVGLARAGEGIPLLSIPYICRFQEHGIEYMEPFPDAVFWVNEHLKFEHGSVHASGIGATAAKQSAHGTCVGYGHIHRQEMVAVTRDTAKGARTHWAGSPGCLCRIDGAVPSTKTGISEAGTQVRNKAENWQQGIWVFFYEEGGRQFAPLPEVIQIWDGWAQWRGKVYTASVDVDGNQLESNE